MSVFLCSTSVLPDFSWYNKSKWGKIHQNGHKNTKWPENTKPFHPKAFQNGPELAFLV
jgi:hypothetical protein